MMRGIVVCLYAIVLTFTNAFGFVSRDFSFISRSYQYETKVTPNIKTRCLGPASLATRALKKDATTIPTVSTVDNVTKDEAASNENIDEDDTIFGFPRETVAGPLALLLFSQFMLFIGVGAVIPSIPLYGKEIGFSSAANGVVISAPAVAMLIGSKWGGNFADTNRKPAMLLGMAIIAISDVGTAFANGIVMLVVARLGLGAGRCISESGERGMLADLAGQVPELRGRALAAQSAMIAIGIAIGAPLGGIIVEKYGPRASFLCVSAAAIFALGCYLFLPETRGLSQENPIASTDKVDNEESSGPTNVTMQAPLVDWPELLSMNQWRGLALCQCGASIGFAAKIASIPILAAATLPGGAAGAGFLLSAAGLSGLIGGPIGGWLTDRISAKSTIILSGIVSSVSLMMIPIALSLPPSLEGSPGVIIPFLGNLELGSQALAFSLVVIGWSIGATAQGPALQAFAQEMAPAGAEATAMALPRAAGDGTYIVTPFLLGLVTDSFSSIPGIECAVAGSATLLGVLALSVLASKAEDGEKA